MAVLLAINPSEAQRFVECFGIGDRGLSRILFKNSPKCRPIGGDLRSAIYETPRMIEMEEFHSYDS